MAKPRVLILTFSETRVDPRVLRQIDSLVADYVVISAGKGPFSFEGVESYELPKAPRSILGKLLNGLKLVAGFHESFYWSHPQVQAARTILAPVEFDVVVANELSALPLALDLARKRGAKVLFDAHEYYPGHMPEKLYFRLLGSRQASYLARKYIPQADSRMTVSSGIAELYRKFCGSDFFLFHNSPFYERRSPSEPKEGRIRMIHSGGFNPGRSPEVMVELMEHLDSRFSLDFMFVNRDSKAFQAFRERYESERVRFVDPVPLREVPGRLNEYDIGLYLLPVKSPNQKYALPNKIFEYVQARLAIAVWPSEEMARFVREHDIGWVSQEATVQSMASTLNGVSIPELRSRKANLESAAMATSCEESARALMGAVQELLRATVWHEDPGCEALEASDPA